MQQITCTICGKPAACIGRYEDMTEQEPACDECCGHGCEDGECFPIDDEDLCDVATVDNDGCWHDRPCGKARAGRDIIRGEIREREAA